MSTYIGKVSIDGAPEIPVGSTLYGICDTVADTGAKVVKLDNFDELINGVTVHVKFTYGNRAAMTNSFTLKVGTTSAKVIKNPGGSVAWQAGAVISFTYDATANQWSVNDSTASAANVNNTYDPFSSDPISGQGVAAAMNYLGDAAWKGVVEEIIEEGNTSNKNSTDLPTTAAIINYVDSRPTGLRIYRQSIGFNVDLPLVVSRTAAANLGMGGINNSYTDGVYGIVWTETEKIPTLNPSTGLMKAAAYQGSGEYLTNLNATNILSGTLAVARLADSGATAGAYGPTQNTQVDFGESINIPYLVVDVKGRITAVESRTIRLPQSDNMDTKAGQYGTNAAREYSLLMKKSDNNDNEIDYVQFSSNNAVTLNPSLGRITAPGGFVGKATSAGTADVANAVSWLNVTDRPSLIIAGLTLGLAGNNNSFEITAAQLRYNLGLSNALHFIGQVPVVNGQPQFPDGAQNGDVVLADGNEYVYIETNAQQHIGNWEKLGDENSFKIKQSVISDIAVQSPLMFVTRISQDAHGVITVTKAEVPFATKTAAGIVSIVAQEFGGLKSFMDGIKVYTSNSTNKLTINGNSIEATTVNGNNQEQYDTILLQPHGGYVTFGAAASTVAFTVHGTSYLNGHVGIGIASEADHVLKINGSTVIVADSTVVAHADIYAEANVSQLAFFPETNAKGTIGKTGQRWNTVYVSNYIRVGSSSREGFTAAAEGNVVMNGSAPSITMNPTDGTSWVITDTGTLLRITNTTATLEGYSNGFKVTSRLYINQDLPLADPYDFFVNGRSLLYGLTKVQNSTNSSSFSTGALTVTGGVGIAQNVNIGGKVGIGTTIDTSTTDPHELVISGSTLMQLSQNDNTYNVAHFDVKVSNGYGWLDFYPEVSGQGNIGGSEKPWYRGFFLDQLVIANQGSVYIKGNGSIELEAYAPALLFNTITNSAADWSVQNDQGTFIITDSDDTHIEGTSDLGWEIYPALAINERITAIGSNSFYVNGMATINNALGLGVAAQSGIALTVNDYIKFVHGSSALAHLRYLSTANTGVNENTTIRFYPDASVNGLIGLDGHRWYGLYLANILDLRNTNSDAVSITVPYNNQGVGAAILSVSSGAEAHIITLSTSAVEDTTLLIHTDFSADYNSILKLQSVNPKIVFDTLWLPDIEEGNVDPSLLDWTIENYQGALIIGNGEYNITSTRAGVAINAPLYINDSFHIVNDIESTHYTNGSLVIEGGVGISKRLNVYGMATVKDYIRLVHSYGAANDPDAQDADLAHLRYDEDTKLLLFYPDYSSDDEIEGYIGIDDPAQKWHSAFFSHEIKISRQIAGTNDSIDLNVSDSAITITAPSPRLILNTTTSEAADWTIINTTGTFTITDNITVNQQTLALQGLSEFGFFIYPRLFINTPSNDVASDNYVFSVDSYAVSNNEIYNNAKMNVYVGIGTESDPLRITNNASPAQLTVQGQFKLVYDTHLIQDMAIMKALSDNAVKQVEFYPEEQVVGFLGLLNRPWYELYLTHKIEITSTDDHILIEAKQDASHGINVSLTSTDATTSPRHVSGMTFVTNKNQSAVLTVLAPAVTNIEATIAVQSQNPYFALVGTNNTWTIKNLSNIFTIALDSVAQSEEYFRGHPLQGFSINPRLYINPTPTGTGAISEKKYHLFVGANDATAPSQAKFSAQVGIGTDTDYQRGLDNTNAALVVQSYFKLVYDEGNAHKNQAHMICDANGIQFYPEDNGHGSLGIANHYWYDLHTTHEVTVGSYVTLHETNGLTLSADVATITFDSTVENATDWMFRNNAGTMELRGSLDTYYMKATAAGFVFKPCLTVGSTLQTDYAFYVNGNGYFDGDVTITGGLNLSSHLLPTTDNAQTLGSSTYRWQKLYVGTDDSYGDPFTPVYWNAGVPAPVSVTQYKEFTLNSNGTTVTLSDAAYKPNTAVLAIVITNGEGGLNSPINWEARDGSIVLTTAATSNGISGYIITARGTENSRGSNSLVSYKARELVGTYGGQYQPVYFNNGVATALAFTPNRLYFSASETEFKPTNHYSSLGKLAVNYTTEPVANFHVEGTSFFNGDVLHAAITYFGNTQASYVNATGNARLQSLEIIEDLNNGRGISLVAQTTAGAIPTYGLFVGNISRFGTHGEINDTTAVYYTAERDSSKVGGWIFRDMSNSGGTITQTNIFSINTNGKIYIGTDGIIANSNPGIYWTPYKDTTNTAQADKAGIYQIRTAQSTVLTIEQTNDAEDYINLKTPADIKINDMAAFTVQQSARGAMLGINVKEEFPGGINVGWSLISTGNALQVVSQDTNPVIMFTAGQDGNTYVNNALGVGMMPIANETHQLVVDNRIDLYNNGTMLAHWLYDPTARTVWFYPETTATGSIGLASNRWKEAYFSHTINLLQGEGSNITSIIMNGNGTMALRATNPQIDLITNAAANSNWFIKNYSSVLQIADTGLTEKFEGYVGSGFKVTSRLYINENIPTEANADLYDLYVKGTSYLKGNVSMHGNLLPDSNGQDLGASEAGWRKVYIGTQDSYGSVYQPIYWNNGVPTESFVVQRAGWSIPEGARDVTLTAPGVFTADTYVILLMVTSGEKNLQGPITWSSDEDTLTLTTESTVTGGAVSGYVLCARGKRVSVTMTNTSLISEEPEPEEPGT